MKRLLPIALLGVLLVGVFTALLVTRPWDERYTPVGDGLALGPAQRHQRSGADLVARTAKDALDAAAGSAGGVPTDVADLQETRPEQTLLDLANQERGKNGLNPVAFDPALLAVARARAVDQLPEGPLSHYNALGELAFVGLLADAGVSYTLAGENLARSSSSDATVVERLHQALMDSPTHRANILEPTFSSLAIGAALDPSGRIAFAQIFRTP